MPIVFRNDSDGYTHQIWAQEQAASCAVASIWMARSIARQMTFSETEWDLACRIYRNVVGGLVTSGPATLDPRVHQANQSTFGNMFSNFGTFMDQVIKALEKDKLKIIHNTGSSCGVAVDPQKLSETTPAIILLGWYGGNSCNNRQGGHFIVAARVTSKGTVVYLDPWQGQLRELGVGPNYPGGGIFEHIVYISA